MSHFEKLNPFVYLDPIIHFDSIREVIAPPSPVQPITELISQIASKFVSSLTPEVLKGFNGRLERGLELAKNGAVTSFDDSSTHPRRFKVRSSDGTNTYIVDLDAKTCDCQDSQKGHTCKHRIAAYYFDQVRQAKPVQPEQPKPTSREDQILKELGFEPNPKSPKDDQPTGFRLGMLYRRFLHGADLNQQGIKVTIQDITREKVMPHPSQPAEEKWCLWVSGLPEGMPNGVLFGAAGEHDLLNIFGPVSIITLKGKPIVIYPKRMNVAGQTKIAIRFRGAS